MNRLPLIIRVMFTNITWAKDLKKIDDQLNILIKSHFDITKLTIMKEVLELKVEELKIKIGDKE